VRERRHVDRNAPALGDVGHVERDDGGQTQLEDLRCEVEIPREVARVQDRDDAVQRRLARLLAEQNVDRHEFLSVLGRTVTIYGWKLYAFVLMGNHYHLQVETPEANLSRAIQWLGGGYGVWFNRRHRRSGHLFGGRFKAVLIADEGQLMEVSRYVHLNPGRVAGLGLGKEARRRLAQVRQSENREG